MNKQPILTAQRIEHDVQHRFDPLPDITPERLTSYHRAFKRGHLRNAALMWDSMCEVDSKIIAVKPKRESAVSRHGYDFIFSEGQADNPRAQQHKDALQHFYSNVTAIHGVEQDDRGGFALLIRQMMRAIGDRFSAHHIVWRPSPSGLTADFYYVPLWFFERTTGRLRFLESDYALYGVPLEPGSWLITRGIGLMPATAVAYMYKRLPLQDLLIYCKKVAVPGIHAETSAKKDSEEWQNLEEAVLNFGIDFAMVTSTGVKVNPIDIASKGELPHPKLIDYMDREIAILWRGGDLATMSAGDAVGASVQEGEREILEEDDAEMVTDALNEYVDKMVIRYTFGEEPLAWIRVKTPTRQDVETDIRVDQHLMSMGVPMSIDQAVERYDRTLPDSNETLISRPAGEAAAASAPRSAFSSSSPPPATPAVAKISSAANEAVQGAEELLANSRLLLARAQHAVLNAIAEPLLAIYNADLDPAERDRQLIEFRDTKLPGILLGMNADPATAYVLRDMMNAAVANGIEEATLV